MSAWWSYRLSDFLLFSPQTYYRLFELYHESIWPAQLLGLGLGFAILWLLKSDPGNGRRVFGMLGICWLWIAWGFHWRWYQSINWAAAYFSVAFGLEAILLLYAGLIRDNLELASPRPLFLRVGFLLFLVALILQPFIGPVVGRRWVQAELFGLTPDPTVMATLGILLLTDGRHRWILLIVPLLWCFVSGATLWAMGSPEAWIMVAAGVLALGLSACRIKRL